MDITKLTTRSAIPCGYPPGAEPFLASIIANRDDDTPRLVFADWLQEQGDDERAEFIRLQIELHIITHGMKRNVLQQDVYVKFDRQLDLAERNKAAWTTGFPPRLLTRQSPLFVRGFPRAAYVKPSEWRVHGERIREWVPVESVYIDGEADRYDDLISQPTLVGLSALELHRAGDAELRTLAGSSALDTLESLIVVGRNLDGTVETPVLRTLFGSPRLSRLRELRVLLDRSGDTLGFVVGNSPHLRNLQTLSLSDAMGTEAARELFDSPNLANVTELALPNNPMGDIAVRSLVRSKYLTRLTTLDLRRAGLTAASARVLAEWPGLRTVSALLLDGNDLTATDAGVILNSKHAESLSRAKLTL